MEKNKGLTLMEMTIVMGIVLLLATALLILLNPMKEIQRTIDAKRKKELNVLRKTYEDYYTDHNCYPRPTVICYQDQDQTYCPICGPKGGNVSPYLPALPCDPQSPKREYLYQADTNTCPQWYKIYAFLATADPKGGLINYNYVVSSGNVPPDPYPTIEGYTPTAAPTTDPANINYYCSATGCKLCYLDGQIPSCDTINDYCADSPYVYNSEVDCLAPANGCLCL